MGKCLSEWLQQHIDELFNLLINVMAPLFSFAQIVGLLCFVLGIICFYQKDDKRLKISMMLLNISQMLHFALLGAVTACLGAFLALIRTGISIKTASRRVAFGFIIFTFCWGVYLAQNYTDMLPIIGSCIGTYALFCLSGIKMRIAFLFGAACWLANNIIVGSIGTTLLELSLIIVNITTIIRLWRSPTH
jgi:hypothetical protein